MPGNLEAVLDEGFGDYREFVNPLVALRVQLSGEPERVVRAEGGRLLERDGRVIEDFHGTQAFGHRHPLIAAAVRGFLDSDSPNWFPSRVNPYAGRLARVLCERASLGSAGAPSYSNAFFASSGSEAVEAALKLARAATKRPKILALGGAYHGCTMGSCSLMADGPYREMFAPHLPGAERIPSGDVDELRRRLEKEDAAAVVVEPIQLEGGVRPLSPEFIAALCELTERHGTLLVADEVQTGMGRTGRYLASGNWPRRPDAVLLGKHLGGGLLPISAMLTRRELFERAYGKNFETSEAHNCTFTGSAMVCVAALATQELLSGELISRVGRIGADFRRELTESLSGLPLFQEVRGEGLIAGIELKPSDHPWLSFDHFGMEDLAGHPTVGVLLCQRLYKRGFFCFVCGHDWSVVRIQPRFNIEAGKLSEFARAVKEELGYLCSLG